MDALVREEIDAITNVRSTVGGAVKRCIWIDLTAGDAALTDGYEWHQGCSPGILAWHALHAPRPVKIRLLEIQEKTYERLIENLADQLPRIGYQRTGASQWEAQNGFVQIYAVNKSGFDMSLRGLRTGDAVLSFNDPNAITQWAKRPSFDREVQQRTWMHRSMTTMGCNVGGCGRSPLEVREAWYGHIRDELSALPDYRDACVARVVRDGSKWAYLITTANKTSWRTKTNRYLRVAFEKVGREVDSAWWRTKPKRFSAIIDELFLTKSERESV